MYDDPLTWQDAKIRCGKVHHTGNLAAITSSGVNGVITNLVKVSAWIGLNDIRQAGK